MGPECQSTILVYATRSLAKVPWRDSISTRLELQNDEKLQLASPLSQDQLRASRDMLSAHAHRGSGSLSLPLFPIYPGAVLQCVLWAFSALRQTLFGAEHSSDTSLRFKDEPTIHSFSGRLDPPCILAPHLVRLFDVPPSVSADLLGHVGLTNEQRPVTSIFDCCSGGLQAYCMRLEEHSLTAEICSARGSGWTTRRVMEFQWRDSSS